MGGKSNNMDLEASLSTLLLSIGSAAAIALGLAPNPQNQKMEKNLPMARFNIDLLLVLKEKTKNNLSGEESQFLGTLLADLQAKFVAESQKK